MNSNILQGIAAKTIAAHQQGNLAEAERLCQQLLQLDPVSGVARNILGIIRSQQGRHTEAIALLAAAVKSDPRSLGNLANHGLVLQAAGRFAAALASFDAFLKLAPDHPAMLANRANSLRSLKRYAEALAVYDKVLALNSAVAENHYNRSITLADMNRRDDALAGYDKAIALKPAFPAAWTNRANLLRQMKRYDEALASYDKALAIDPANVSALFNRGVTLKDLQRDEDALANYDKALALNPGFTLALTNRANLLRALNRREKALEDYDAAIAAEPRNAEFHFNRAAALAEMGRSDAALASYATAIELKPDYVEALYNNGLILQDQQRWEEALRCYDRALKVKPDYVEALNNLGIILNTLDHIDGALEAFDRAIAVNPDYSEAYFNRSSVLANKTPGDLQAIRDLERVLALNPDYEYARGDLLHLRMQVGDWSTITAEIAALDAGLRAGRPVVRPFAYQAVSESPADLQACSVLYAAKYFPARPPAPHPVVSSAKIRVGYVSADFREQATAYLTVGLIEQHDKDKFEIIAFDNGGDNGGPTRQRLNAAFDRVIDIRTLSDDAAAARIRAEGIDILVNLAGSFGTPRMGVFARKPAPIQVNYLGFPATLGADYIDYIVADRIVIPEGERHHYTEKVAYLPDSYQANDSKRAIDPARPTRSDYGLPENAFVFCNFNQSYKLTPAAFAGWMKLLSEVDGSVLWILQSTPALADNLRREAVRLGVAADRLVFAQQVPIGRHLARLALADLFLDSRPYNAHTTASDALWASLPLITCRGTAFPGRVAASLLTAAGVPELVTETMDEFHALALKLARDKDLLASIRTKLALNRATCALFDTDRFRRNLESAYETMMTTWRDGNAPAGFTVS